MNAAQLLRQKILDLAIRGKLTKREKGDEPAAELLARIAAEKQKLTAAKKIKKEKPLPPISEDEMPFDLPKDWIWCRIGDISLGFQYGTATKSHVTGLVPVLRMGNLQDGEIDFTDLVYTSNKDDIKTYALKDGDLLFNRTNSAEKVGKVSIFRGSRLCIYAGYLVRFRTIFCDCEYINIVMNTHYQWTFCQTVKSDAVNQSNISASKFAKFLIPLPPLAEQKRIVSRVEELLAEVDKYSAAMDALAASSEMMEKKVLDLAIRGKLTKREKGDEPAAELLARIAAEKQKLIAAKKIKKEKPLPPITDDEKPFDIPEGWEWCRLGDVFQHNTGKALNKGKTDGKMRKYITTSNVYWDEFKIDDLREMPFTKDELDKCTIRKGDLLVCEGGDVGRAAIWNRDESVCIQNHLHRLRPYVEACVPYFCYIFRLYKVTNRLRGKGIALQGFSSGMLHNLLIPLPPLAEQKRIVARVDELLAECRKMRGE